MKRGTPDHPKMLMLTMEMEKVYVAHRKKSVFGGKAEAVGTLEVLWEWTSRYAIQGNIGKWPDDVIARAIEWPFSGKELIYCLVKSKWLDNAPDPDRLVIHDIKDHASNCWRQNLEDAGLTWWDGSNPRKYKLSKTPEKLQKNSRRSPQPEPEPELTPETFIFNSGVVQTSEHVAVNRPEKPPTTFTDELISKLARAKAIPNSKDPPTPNGFDPADLAKAQSWLHEYARMLCKLNWPPPDAQICGQILQAAGGLEPLHAKLKDLWEFRHGHPTQSYGWFLSAVRG